MTSTNMPLWFLPIWLAMLGGGFSILRLSNGDSEFGFATGLIGAGVVGAVLGYGLTSFLPSKHLATVAMSLLALVGTGVLIAPPWTAGMSLAINVFVGLGCSVLGYAIAKKW
ncbi:MAG: hypothetical protein KDB14_18455 [Planctomycetales bacterium]|nr:hypothetical protein [Planctomycetales bacterium]